VDDIVGSRFRGFGIARHVVADVVFDQLGHEAVDGAAGGGETLEDIRAGTIFARRTLSSCPMTFLVRLTRSNFSLEVSDIFLSTLH